MEVFKNFEFSLEEFSSIGNTFMENIVTDRSLSAKMSASLMDS